MIDRIKQVMDYSQLSAAAFADTIGISRSGLTHLLNGRNQPSLDVAKKILANFPEVSTEWLIMGVGEMLRLDDGESLSQQDMDLPDGTVTEYPAEISKSSHQTDLFGEFANPGDSDEDIPVQDEAVIVDSVGGRTVVSQPAVGPESVLASEVSAPAARPQEAPARVRKISEPKSIPANGKRDKHQPFVSPEKKLQRIVFFYDDHSFEVYSN